MAFDREHQKAGAGATAAPESAAYAPSSPAEHAFASGGLGVNYSSPSLFAQFATLDTEPSLDIDALADTVGGEALAPVEGAEAPTEVAEQGFAGAPGALPHKAQLEQSFGLPLDGVEAYVDENAQHANGRLGAEAYASGHRIAFGTDNPTPDLVAHELTHVLQHTGAGGAKASSNGGSGGIETSGEHEAETVQAAVAGGRPARTALQGTPNPLAAGKGPGPARKAGQKPALSTPFSTGLSFSPTGFEQSGSYSLWSAPEFRVPIAAVPGLSAKVAPSVSASVSGGVDWKKKAVTASVGVDGSVKLGLAYGVPKVAEVFGGMEASASGRFSYERSRGTSTSQSKSIRARDTWSLNGAITLGANLAITLELGGGIMEKGFRFGHVEIGTLTGLSWENGRFKRQNVGWSWGAQPKALFRQIKSAIDQAKRIMELPKEAAKAAWNGMKDAGGWVAKGGGWVWDNSIGRIDFTPWN